MRPFSHGLPSHLTHFFSHGSRYRERRFEPLLLLHQLLWWDWRLFSQLLFFISTQKHTIHTCTHQSFLSVFSHFMSPPASSLYLFLSPPPPLTVTLVQCRAASLHVSCHYCQSAVTQVFISVTSWREDCGNQVLLLYWGFFLFLFLWDKKFSVSHLATGCSAVLRLKITVLIKQANIKLATWNHWKFHAHEASVQVFRFDSKANKVNIVYPFIFPFCYVHTVFISAILKISRLLFK